MKKIIIALVAVFVVFVAGIVVLMTVDFNRAGKDNVYVQIVGDGEIEETRLDSGEVMKRYWYKQQAFDADGEALDVEFSSAKNLRHEAYLMLYINDDQDVTSYDEVKFEDIPKAAQQKLN